jgi:hypothetical protein
MILTVNILYRLVSVTQTVFVLSEVGLNFHVQLKERQSLKCYTFTHFQKETTHRSPSAGEEKTPKNLSKSLILKRL